MANKILKRQFPYRGPLSSHDLNSHIEDVTTQIDRISDKVLETESVLSRRRLDDALGRTAGTNGNFQHRYEKLVEQANALNDIINTDTTQDQVFTFFDTDHVHYEVDDGLGVFTGYPVANRCPVDTTFGEVTLPYNGFKSMFWSATADDRGETLYAPTTTVVINDLSVVAPTTLEFADERNAFDGSSFDPMLIRASYPIDTDVEEVRFDINIQVPQDIIRRANALTIEPAPELRCSIVGIKYSDTATIGTTNIPGLPTIDDNNPIYDTNPIRFLFNPVFITALKITMTSKHFVIENGRKVFYVGLREASLNLIEWDPTWSDAPGAFSNNGFFVKLAIPQVAGVTPSTCYFDTIEVIRTSPEMSTTAVTANGTPTGVRVMLFEEDTLSAVAFDSVTDVFPYTVTGSRDHIWVGIELDRNNETGNVPLFKTLLVRYTVKS